MLWSDVFVQSSSCSTGNVAYSTLCPTVRNCWIGVYYKLNNTIVVSDYNVETNVPEDGAVLKINTGFLQAFFLYGELDFPIMLEVPNSWSHCILPDI